MTKNPHLKQLLGSFRRSHNKLADSYNYVLSQYRYGSYYGMLPTFLLRTHIREQIDFRIQVMNKQCYQQGSCIHCGCTTTALQMSNRTCEGEEYPPILPKKTWEKFARGKAIIASDTSTTTWNMIVTKSISTLIITSYMAGKEIREVPLRTPLRISIIQNKQASNG